MRHPQKDRGNDRRGLPGQLGGSSPRWSAAARRLRASVLQRAHLTVRIAGGAEPVLAALSSGLGLVVSDAPFVHVVEAARAFDWTRDQFDRLIDGQSDAEQCELVTRDRTIRRRYRRAYWR